MALLLTAWAAVPGHLAGQTTNYTFTTLAGVGSRGGSADGIGGATNLPLFNRPTGLVLNSSGNLYVTDSGNALIRVVTPAGAVTTLAGSPEQSGSADGTGVDTGAKFFSPQGPSVDSAGNIYVAEYYNYTIRKITPAGVVTTLAGLAGNVGSTDDTGTAARFNQPTGTAVDSAGNVYVADSGNNVIRKVTPAGVVTTFAGTAGLTGSADGTGTAARFSLPRGIAIDSAGTLYIADTGNDTIRKITSAGVVTTVAGAAGQYGAADGQGTAARFNFPNGVSVDGAGNIYVADAINNAIRKVTPNGSVTTLAGLAGAPAGRVDGAGNVARFAKPTGVAVDPAGNVYVADDDNQQIRKISPTGVVTTVAGVSGNSGTLDGNGYYNNPGLFYLPASTATDAAGNIYVADMGNNTIRMVTPTGVVTTFAGSPLAYGRLDGTGSAASFTSPAGVALDSAGNVYVADTGNHTIRMITSAGVVTTLAGTAGTAGAADGSGTSATFNYPSGVAADSAGNVYVADYDNHTIRKITPAGQVTTLAGTAGIIGHADGLGAAASFSYPRAVTVDSAGNVYVADTGNHTIRKITPGGLVMTLAGSAGSAGNADGAGNIARFNGPSCLAADQAGNIFVADTNSSTIRKITPAGVVTTIGGMAGVVGNTDAAGTASRFNNLTGIAVAPNGALCIADTRNQTIRVGVLPGGTGGSGGGSGGTGGTGGSGSTVSAGDSGGTGGSSPSVGAIGATNSNNPAGVGFLLHPSGLALDSIGFTYVSDTANNCVKVIASDSTISVFAGKSGAAGSADGTGTSATFNGPIGLARDASNSVYVCDTGNATIRKITSTGVVTTLAGSPGSRGTQDGTGSAALFSSPTGIVVDSAGNLYVTDSINSTIRMITSAGVVTTYAGTAKKSGYQDGTVANALFNNPTGLAIDANDNLFIADTYNNVIRKINTANVTVPVIDPTTGVQQVDSTGAGVTMVTVPAGQVTTIAGSAGISGVFDGTGIYALFNLPQGVAVDGSGNTYVADTGNNCIRVITSQGTVKTISGMTGFSGHRDGPSASALYNQPQALLVTGTVVVADTGNSVIRVMDGAYDVSTLGLKNPTSTSVTPSSTSTSTTTTIDPNTGLPVSGGGGAIEPWFITAFLALCAIGYRRQRRGRAHARN